MIPVSVVPPGRADPRLLDVPGAFVWWYVDLVDGNGDGLVLIASWGLPFLPGLLDAARRGRPEAPRGWPALSLAVYRGGACAFYLLDVPAHATWAQVGDREVLTLGASTVCIGYADGAIDVVAEIDAEGAGQRITGQIRVRGASPPWSEPADAVHGWSVLAACALGEAVLTTGGSTLRVAGRAYVDRNAGTRPIDALGMSAWTWARVALPDHELVVWDVDGVTAVIWSSLVSRCSRAEQCRVRPSRVRCPDAAVRPLHLSSGLSPTTSPTRAATLAAWTQA